MTGEKVNIWRRRRSRRALVQALYKWHMTATALDEILVEFHQGEALSRADKSFFSQILRHAVDTNFTLHSKIIPYLDRDYDRLDFVEKAILELAASELELRKDIPYRVVIDEYVELAKTFGAQDSYKYINGVLDKLWLDYRKAELT